MINIWTWIFTKKKIVFYVKSSSATKHTTLSLLLVACAAYVQTSSIHSKNIMTIDYHLYYHMVRISSNALATKVIQKFWETRLDISTSPTEFGKLYFPSYLHTSLYSPQLIVSDSEIQLLLSWRRRIPVWGEDFLYLD